MPLPPGETVLLTLRLRGTLPAAVARDLKARLTAAPATCTTHHHVRKQLFGRFDAALDQRPVGPQHFECEKTATALAGELLLLEELGFVVHGFAILPNHAHAIVHLPAHAGLSFAKALDQLHLRTEAACRRLVRPCLPAEAQFWQPGWHEVPLLDEAELGRALAYLRQQPTRAGLAARFHEWPYVDERVGGGVGF